MAEGSVDILVNDLEILKDKFEALTVAVASLIEDHQSRQPPTVWTYDVRFPINVQNLHNVEYTSSAIKRWVGPNPSVEFQPRLRAGRSYKILALAPNFITDEARDTFRFRINGIVTKPQRVRPDIYEAKFSVDHGDYQTIELLSDVVMSPSDLLDSADSRLLSFAISYVHIVQIT